MRNETLLVEPRDRTAASDVCMHYRFRGNHWPREEEAAGNHADLVAAQLLADGVLEIAGRRTRSKASRNNFVTVSCIPMRRHS